MPEDQKTFQKRQIAYKARICDILNGGFARGDFSSGYIRVNNVDVSRVNIIATVVYKPEHTANYGSVIVDDGTGRISLRSFNDGNVFLKSNIGDVILIIGRVREFNNERYISSEIFKKINNIDWVNVRKLELSSNTTSNVELKNETVTHFDMPTKVYEEVLSLIKKLDDGDGVLVDDVINNYNKNNAEVAISKLLESGNIFEIRPGKLRVLE